MNKTGDQYFIRSYFRRNNDQLIRIASSQRHGLRESIAEDEGSVVITG